MTTANRRIPLMAASAAVLLAIIWYFLFWSPQAKSLTSAHKARAAAEQKMGELQQQMGSLQALVKQIPADNAKFAEREAALPDNPQLDQALNLLHQAAVQTGVTVSNINPSTPQGAAGNGSSQQSTALSGGPAITLNISVNGGFVQIRSFLNALDQLPRTLVVDKVSISISGVNSTASITARIFYAGQATP